MKTNHPKHIPITQIKKQLLSSLDKRALVLVGLMGAGKSVIGKRIATMLGLPFYDSDQEIEKAAQMTITEFFKVYGESEFRALEQHVTLSLMKKSPLVLATGGGAYINEDIRQVINKNGISIWLKADLDILMKRVSRHPTRPLLQTANPKETMKKLMEQRYPIYAKANLTINSYKESRHTVAQNVIRSVQNYIYTEINDRNNQHANQDRHC
ncbi:shikimate kinase [Bartonella quintana]|uniref:Shikimate kinase n=3 Tax=Bartonella quintana TaxID=803 RepID=AROK_BARQU|nr:shikimate kinase [Bartonella quintana]Q6G1H5.1 RecName: Full=Shikimate kinase; Short=SK [Bartonella quintana str. Toulouse]ETS13716.1 shikimate kinase [Bartonella quintana BQ2-D70]ETS14846.1 shikimate kinase [Bartonella quintana JK 73rel]ETS16686.1 shikimate kinase [Bartonella quintana JK 73]ETS16933.1 shikimate kinase [Bartonella quintana JK 12]ETS19227.1 shikimate kinase [Bartonella quintana JK 7]